jgi:hypothetical protein
MLAASVVSSPMALADDPGVANARYTIEIGQSQGARPEPPRVYHVVGAIGGKTQLTYGNRVPIAGGSSTTGFSYEHVGLTVDLLSRRNDDTLLQIEAKIEGTLLAEGSGGASGAPPVLGTFNESFTAVLADGRQVRVAEITQPDGARYYVDLRADVLD